MKYIVCNGDLSKGFKFYGVFATYEEALKYGEQNFDHSMSFSIHQLNK